MQTFLYKLKFQGPTHFGDTGIDLENVSERVNSDTLFSAFVNVIRTIDGVDAATDFVNKFVSNPPFLISSLFVYSKDKLFLPRPLFDEHIPAELKMAMGKELKITSWLSAEVFLKWIEGKIEEKDIHLMIDERDEYKKSHEREIRPRVSLDRTHQNSNIYHCGYHYFKEDAGLYGIVAFNKTEYINPFHETLENLGEIGLGGEKTYGVGMFKVSLFKEVSSPITEILAAKSHHFVLLSLYHPSAEELPALQRNLVAYDIVRKKGWIASGRYALPLKRKSVGFFAEGSITLGHPRGCLIDVTPDSDPFSVLDHKIYRYGYALTAPLGGNNGQ